MNQSDLWILVQIDDQTHMEMKQTLTFVIYISLLPFRGYHKVDFLSCIFRVCKHATLAFPYVTFLARICSMNGTRFRHAITCRWTVEWKSFGKSSPEMQKKRLMFGPSNAFHAWVLPPSPGEWLDPILSCFIVSVVAIYSYIAHSISPMPISFHPRATISKQFAICVHGTFLWTLNVMRFIVTAIKKSK